MPRMRTWIVVGVWTLVVLLVVGNGIIFLYQMRVKQHRQESANRLKTIAIAAHMHHDHFKFLVNNGTVEAYGAGGRKIGGPAGAGSAHSGSWAYQLLPALELEHDPTLKFPFPDAQKTKALAPIYHCPMRGRPLYAEGEGLQAGPVTDFALNPYLADPDQGSLNALGFRSIMRIPGGMANAIMFGHAWTSTDDLHNATPGNGRSSIYLGGTNGTARNGKLLLRDDRGQDHYDDWGSPYADGALMGMADASVRFFSYEIPSDVFFHLLNPKGAPPDLPPLVPADEKKVKIK